MKGILLSLILLVSGGAFAITEVTSPNLAVISDTIEEAGGENCTDVMDLSSGINSITVSANNGTWTGVLDLHLSHDGSTYYPYASGFDIINAIPAVIEDANRERIVLYNTTGFNYAKLCGNLAVANASVKLIGSRTLAVLQWISGQLSVGLVRMAHAGSNDKADVASPGQLVSTAITADQVVVTYTTAEYNGWGFGLHGFDIQVRLTTYATTATNFGDCSLESPAGTKLLTYNLAHAGDSKPIQIRLPEPYVIPQNTVVRVVCTPAATTSFTWKANLIGYDSFQAP